MVRKRLWVQIPLEALTTRMFRLQRKGSRISMAQDLKLNQVIALQKVAKPHAESAITQAYQGVQRSTTLAGISEVYDPIAEDGQQLPPKGNKLQDRVPDILRGVIEPVVRMLDLTATLDAGNQAAKADILNPDTGEVLLADVPVSTLLMLEKTLNNLEQILRKTPVLDPSATWVRDPDNMCYRTEPAKKARTEKVPVNHVKAPATDKHPAQVEILYLDKVVGYWTTVHSSGAVSERTLRELTERLRKLRDAVKVAREQANMTTVADVKIGAQIFEYLGWANAEPPA